MIRRNIVRSGLLAFTALATALPAAGQSILAARGLGYPLEPLDARSRALGGVTAGAAGSFFSLSNPAAAAAVPAPAASVTFQNDWYDATGDQVEADGGTARFPVIALAFPIVGRWSGAIAYGSFLDQHWRATVSDSMDLVTGRVEVVDRFVSEGAVARLRGGVAYGVSPRLAVGIAGELYTGSVRDTLVRAVGNLAPVFFSSTYSYSGVGASAGFRWSPVAALSLSGAVGTGGTLEAEAEDSAGISGEYSLPLRLDAGATARIARQAQVVASVHWAGWSDANDALSARGGARDELTVSGGVEYDGLTVLRTQLPLRVGARLNQLPFRWEENEFPEERALTAGWGMVLGRGTAQLDFAVERGWRGGDAAGFDEPYWRGAVTMSILGR